MISGHPYKCSKMIETSPTNVLKHHLYRSIVDWLIFLEEMFNVSDFYHYSYFQGSCHTDIQLFGEFIIDTWITSIILRLIYLICIEQISYLFSVLIFRFDDIGYSTELRIFFQNLLINIMCKKFFLICLYEDIFGLLGYWRPCLNSFICFWFHFWWGSIIGASGDQS